MVASSGSFLQACQDPAAMPVVAASQRTARQSQVRHTPLTFDNDELYTAHVHRAKKEHDEPWREDAYMAQPAHEGCIHEGVQGVPMPEVWVLTAANPGLWEASWLERTVVHLHTGWNPFPQQPSEQPTSRSGSAHDPRPRWCCRGHIQPGGCQEACSAIERLQEDTPLGTMPACCMLGLPDPEAASGDASELVAWLPGRSPMQMLALSLTALLTGAQVFSISCPVALLALRLIGRASWSCHSDGWEPLCP